MTPTGISYTLYEPNIHDIVFHDVKYTTLDLFYVKMEDLLRITPPREPVRLMLHTSQMPSIQYMTSRSRLLKQKYPNVQKARVAIMYPQALQIYLLNMAAHALTHSSPVKLFHKDQTDQARAWLSE